MDASVTAGFEMQHAESTGLQRGARGSSLRIESIVYNLEALPVESRKACVLQRLDLQRQSDLGYQPDIHCEQTRD